MEATVDCFISKEELMQTPSTHVQHQNGINNEENSREMDSCTVYCPGCFVGILDFTVYIFINHDGYCNKNKNSKGDGNKKE